ncbi:MAG: ATP-binding protein [Elusimicrobiales bacterium]
MTSFTPDGPIGRLRIFSREYAATSENSLRCGHFAIFAVCGSLLEVCFGITDILTHRYLLSGIIFFHALSLIVGAPLAYRLKDPRPVFRFNIFGAGVLIMSLVASAGEDGSKALWGYLFPLFSFFLFEASEGMIWAVIMCIGALTLMVFSPSRMVPHVYPAEFYSRFAATYMWLSVAVWWYEFQRNRSNIAMKAANEKLSARQVELTEAEEKYRILFEGARDAVFVTDAATEIVLDANSAAARLVGMKKAELVGMDQRALYPSGAGGPCVSGGAFGGDVSGASGPIVETQVLTRSGELKDVAIMRTPLEIKGRKVVLGLFRDVTERKRMEATMIQSEKMSAVGQLAAGVAHEINNPLVVILGFAQSVCKRLKESDPLVTPLKTIEREAVRCKHLVQSLLVFSRQSSSEEREETDLNVMIGDCIALISARTKTSNIELAVHSAPGLPKITANKNHLQQVIINLANNAIDAMPKGGTLTISTSLSGLRPGQLEIQVRDTGTGIPREIQKKIFEPFFTTKEVGKGTGLGLSLVYEIINKHGGTIELESESGRGTAFIVSLPVKFR